MTGKHSPVTKPPTMTWPEPQRFDSHDRSTWPPLGVDVLTFGIDGGGGFVVSHLDEFDGEFWWLHESPERVAEASVTAWWPLPPTQGGAE